MKNRAKEFIKKELKKRKITYIKLSLMMNDKGYIYSENTIRSKINRGSFSFAFLLEVCDSLNISIICL
jgi:ribose 5-phosphate isomerase RpiB